MIDLKTRFFIKQTVIHQNLKKGKFTDYVLRWKSKGLYTSKLKPFYTAFLHNTKLSRYRMGIKFDKDSLAVE